MHNLHIKGSKLWSVISASVLTDIGLIPKFNMLPLDELGKLYSNFAMTLRLCVGKALRVMGDGKHSNNYE